MLFLNMSVDFIDTFYYFRFPKYFTFCVLFVTLTRTTISQGMFYFKHQIKDFIFLIVTTKDSLKLIR